jgi:hypothetical protein
MARADICFPETQLSRSLRSAALDLFFNAFLGLSAGLPSFCALGALPVLKISYQMPRRNKKSCHLISSIGQVFRCDQDLYWAFRSIAEIVKRWVRNSFVIG